MQLRLLSLHLLSALWVRISSLTSILASRPVLGAREALPNASRLWSNHRYPYWEEDMGSSDDGSAGVQRSRLHDGLGPSSSTELERESFLRQLWHPCEKFGPLTDCPGLLRFVHSTAICRLF